MTEDRPHVVYSAGTYAGATIFPTYADAHKHWLLFHTYKAPLLIATLGRVIDPSTPIVDVNE